MCCGPSLVMMIAGLGLQPKIFYFSWPHVNTITHFWFSGLFFFECKHCRKLCDVFHQCMAQSLLMRPVLVPPRDQQKELHLALASFHFDIGGFTESSSRGPSIYCTYVYMGAGSLPKTSGNIGSLVRFQFGDEQTQAAMKHFRASPLKMKTNNFLVCPA